MRALLLAIALTVALCACSGSLKDQLPIEEMWIAMPDGVRLAADIHWPTERQAEDRYPVLLVYSPYRKDEGRSDNHSWFSYFLNNGYVVARIDIRGTGRSEGTTIPYEYSDIEHDDYSQAHLAETSARIEKVLDATMLIGV